MRDLMRDRLKNVRSTSVYSKVMEVDFSGAQVHVPKDFLRPVRVVEVGGKVMAQAMRAELGNASPAAQIAHEPLDTVAGSRERLPSGAVHENMGFCPCSFF